MDILLSKLIYNYKFPSAYLKGLGGNENLSGANKDVSLSVRLQTSQLLFKISLNSFCEDSSDLNILIS